MKKIFTSLFIIMAAYTNGQVILLDENNNDITNSTVNINLGVSSSSTFEILISNTGNITDTLKVLRSVYSVDAGDQTQFCFGGLCYAYTTNSSSLSITVPQNDTIDYANNGFHALFTSSAVCVDRYVHYRFYNTNHFSDSSGVTLRYVCATGISEEGEQLQPSLSNAYPNPANSAVLFKYQLNNAAKEGKILFHDMLGKVVKEIILTTKQGNETVNINDLKAGIYFYSLVVDNKTISSKKLIVNN